MALREILASFGFQVDQTELKAGHNAVEGLIHKIEGLGAAASAAFVGHEVKEFFESTVQGAVALAKSAVMYGTTAEELQKMQFAAQMSNVSVESLNMGIMRLQRSMFGAKDAVEGTEDVFGKLGTSAKELKEMSGPEEQLSKLADGFVAIQNPAERTGLAMKLFGRGGAQLLPFLLKGSAGIKELTAQVEKLGGGYTEAFIEEAHLAEQAQIKLDMAVRSLRATIVSGMVPAAIWLLDKLKGLAMMVKDLSKTFNLAGLALSGLLGFALTKLPAVVGLFYKLIAGSGLLMAKWLVLWLVFDDLMGLLRGDDSEIGAILDKVFGKGAAEQFVADLKLMTASWADFKSGMANFAGSIGSDIVSWFVHLNDQFNAFTTGLLRALNLVAKTRALLSSGGLQAYNDETDRQVAQESEWADQRRAMRDDANHSSYRAHFDQMASAQEALRASQAMSANGGNWVNNGAPVAPWSMFPQQATAAAHGVSAPTINNHTEDKSVTNVLTLPTTTAGQAKEIGRVVARARIVRDADGRATLTHMEHVKE